jgi:hypothetical protein
VIHRGTGQTEIRATFQDLFGGTIILVNLSVTSVSVACVPDGVNYACTAIANFSNSTTLDVTRSGTAWSSSNTAVATCRFGRSGHSRSQMDRQRFRLGSSPPLAASR